MKIRYGDMVEPMVLEIFICLVLQCICPKQRLIINISIQRYLQWLLPMHITFVKIML